MKISELSAAIASQKWEYDLRGWAVDYDVCPVTCVLMAHIRLAKTGFLKKGLRVTVQERGGHYWVEADFFCATFRHICQDFIGHVDELSILQAKNLAIDFACENLSDRLPASTLEQLKELKETPLE